MTPAISIDDIADKEMRELICADMYTTVSMQSAQALNLKTTKRQIPNTTFQIVPVSNQINIGNCSVYIDIFKAVVQPFVVEDHFLLSKI